MGVVHLDIVERGRALVTHARFSGYVARVDGTDGPELYVEDTTERGDREPLALTTVRATRAGFRRQAETLARLLCKHYGVTDPIDTDVE